MGAVATSSERSAYERVRRAAISSPHLTEAHLYEYHKCKLLKKHALDVIESLSRLQQLIPQLGFFTKSLVKLNPNFLSKRLLAILQHAPNSSSNVSFNEDTLLSSPSTSVLSSRSARKRTATFVPRSQTNQLQVATNSDDQNNSDQNDDDEEEETAEELIQDLQELEKESEPGFHPLVRALYHTVSLCPLPLL
ncbi:hypothetical protein BG004_002649 [Podila humilis]|nr:hypothetical protein BG004_002649 [Podila humilis]